MNARRPDLNRRLSPFALAALLTGLLAGCKGGDQPSAQPEPSAKQPAKAAAVPDLGDPLAGFDPAKDLARLSGTWVVNPQWGRRVDIWHLEGSKAKVIKGVVEREAEALVDLPAPCRLRFTTKGQGGAPDYRWTHNFVFSEGRLYAGQAPAGLLGEDQALICGRRGIFFQKGDQCVFYPEDKQGKRGAPIAAKCALEDDVFTASAGKAKVKLNRRGQVLLADAQAPLERMDSLDEARSRYAQGLEPLPGEAAPPIKAPAPGAQPPSNK